MTDQPAVSPESGPPSTTTTIQTPEGQAEIAPGGPSAMDLMNQESLIYGALRSVIDFELGIDVVELALIRQIEVRSDRVDVKMVLTSPFCPYAAEMLEQVRSVVAEATGKETKVHLLAERWDPRDAGLMW